MRFASVVCLAVCLSSVAVVPVAALDNGLARTPPMGWNTFNCWGGEYDAQKLKEIADALVLSGLRDLGYQYLNIDGGWNVRGGTWEPDLRRFPGGIPLLAEYVHSKGLKLGIYIDSGQGHEKALADKFASWGVDFLKHDDWVTPRSNPTWAAMRDALSATGRPIFYSIHTGGGDGSPEMANMWRTGPDIDNNWRSILSCIGTYASGGGRPGAWPDPDMLEVGNMRNDTEEMTHFSLWCVTSSPLIAGNDLRRMFLSTLHILLNTEAIAVNQDTAFAADPSYGGSGKRVKQSGDMQLWLKTVTGSAKAVVLVNTGATAETLTVNWSDIGLPSGVAQVRDLWEHNSLGPFTDSYSAEVPSHGCKFLKIVAGSDPISEPPATWFPKPEDPKPITPLSKAGWTATSNMGDPSAYIDGDLKTPARPSSPREESWIALDMKSPQKFDCVILDSTTSGVGRALKPYRSHRSAHNIRLYVSDDGTNWRGPVCSVYMGPWNYAAMTFDEQTARHIRIVDSPSDGPEKSDSTTRPNWEAFNEGDDGEQVTEVYVANLEGAARQQQ